MSMRSPAERVGSGVQSTSQRVSARRHQLTLKARENLTMDGVVRVESFDDNEVVLETDEGLMVVRGEGLNIKELNLEAGTLRVDGLVRTLEYMGATLGQKSRGFLAKLFK
ncbi:MAG: sporulation protein YabP [Limnochordia bacterium]|jgi:sporulation protein YabP